MKRRLMLLFFGAMAILGFNSSANAQTAPATTYGYYYNPEATIIPSGGVQSEALTFMRSFSVTNQWKTGQTVGICNDSSCVVFVYNSNGTWTASPPFTRPSNQKFKNSVSAVGGGAVPGSWQVTVIYYIGTSTDWVTGTVTVIDQSGNPADAADIPGAGFSGDASAPAGATFVSGGSGGGGSGGGGGGGGGGGDCGGDDGGDAVHSPTAANPNLMICAATHLPTVPVK